MTETIHDQAQTLHRLVTDLVRKVQFRDRNQICCHGVSVAQCYTLDVMAGQETVTMGALAGRLSVTVSTMTRTVDQLVEKGLVGRCVDPTDRRVCCVGLTPAGREVHSVIRDELVAEQKRVLEQIDPGSRSAVIAAVTELARALDRCCLRPATSPRTGTTGASSPSSE